MDVQRFCKSALQIFAICSLGFITGCSVNPLTGQKDFTGLMSPQQEESIGAEQHQEIIKEYGGEYKNRAIQSYVDEIGQKMARHSDRQDVTYRFTVLDSPIVNAFALPGGYVYVTRGTLAIANNEAELAAVLGHEIGHVAGRHQAARYSRGVLSSLGATVLSAAIGVPAASQAIGVGTNLYMSSYSRDQETQADLLGVRYLSRAGYDTMAMSDFLKDMNGYHSMEAQLNGKDQKQFSYFSSHPDTSGRVSTSRLETTKYPPASHDNDNRDRYLSMMRGMLYGENPSQGYVRNGTFYHPDIGFALSIPEGFPLDNKPDRLVIEGQEGTILVLDMAKSKGFNRAEDYVAQVWLKGQALAPVETIEVNGIMAATTSVPVRANNREADIRLVAFPWEGNKYIRLQMIIPAGSSPAAVNDLKRITYSFHRMTNAEHKTATPYQIDLVKAGRGDTVQSLAARMGVDRLHVEQFAALNGLTPAQPVVAGRMYKIVR